MTQEESDPPQKQPTGQEVEMQLRHNAIGSTFKFQAVIDAALLRCMIVEPLSGTLKGFDFSAQRTEQLQRLCSAYECFANAERARRPEAPHLHLQPTSALRAESVQPSPVGPSDGP